MKILFVIVFVVFGYSISCAQSVAGTWKRIGNQLEDQNGKITDIQKMMEESNPCFKTKLNQSNN